MIHAAAGGVGSFAVALARWRQAKVIATASILRKDYLMSLGAHDVWDYQTQPWPDKLRDVDLVLDLAGGKVLEQSYGVLKSAGTLISIVEPPDLNVAQKFQINARMISVKPSRANLQSIKQIIDQGRLKPFIQQVWPLEDAPQAWKIMAERHVQGKLVLQVNSVH